MSHREVIEAMIGGLEVDIDHGLHADRAKREIAALEAALESMDERTCEWTETHRDHTPIDLADLLDDWVYYESACGNFGLLKFGDYCHCGGKITTPPEAE